MRPYGRSAEDDGQQERQRGGGDPHNARSVAAVFGRQQICRRRQPGKNPSQRRCIRHRAAGKIEIGRIGVRLRESLFQLQRDGFGRQTQFRERQGGGALLGHFEFGGEDGARGALAVDLHGARGGGGERDEARGMSSAVEADGGMQSGGLEGEIRYQNAGGGEELEVVVHARAAGDADDGRTGSDEGPTPGHVFLAVRVKGVQLKADGGFHVAGGDAGQGNLTDDDLARGQKDGGAQVAGAERSQEAGVLGAPLGGGAGGEIENGEAAEDSDAVGPDARGDDFQVLGADFDAHARAEPDQLAKLLWDGDFR